MKTIKRALDELAAAGQVNHEGERRWRRYRLGDKGQTTAESAASP
jgi:DNA-binding transcriptional regulator PaaX